MKRQPPKPKYPVQKDGIPLHSAIRALEEALESGKPVKEAMDSSRYPPDYLKWAAEMRDRVTTFLSLDKARQEGRDQHQLGVHFLADMLELFDFCGPDAFVYFYLEHAVDEVAYRKIVAMIPAYEQIWQACMDRGWTLKRPFDYNDLDNSAYVIPDPDPQGQDGPRKIVVLTDQNCKFLFVLGQNALGQKFHCRRFWDDYKHHFDPKDSWNRRELARYKQRGIREAIVQAEELAHRYADDLPGNQYPRRLSLKTHRKNFFRFRYGDCRDEGYVFSVETGSCSSCGCDGSMGVVRDLNTALMDLHSTHISLCEKDEKSE